MAAFFFLFFLLLLTRICFVFFPCHRHCCLFSHFGQANKVFFVLIPELIFMICLFGYLVFLVVFKWIVYTPADSKFAPSVLIHFIDMFLFTESADNPKLFTGQVCVVQCRYKKTTKPTPVCV